MINHKNRQSLLSGVYARGSIISHTGSKSATCRELHTSEINHSCVSPSRPMGCFGVYLPKNIHYQVLHVLAAANNISDIRAPTHPQHPRITGVFYEVLATNVSWDIIPLIGILIFRPICVRNCCVDVNITCLPVTAMLIDCVFDVKLFHTSV